MQLLEKDEQSVKQLSYRELATMLLRKLAPGFDAAGRTDDAVAAATEYALIERLFPPQPASSGHRAPKSSETEYDQFFKSLGVSRPDSVDVVLHELEQKRTDAWKPRLAERRTDDVDVDAQLRQLESARTNAWRPRGGAA